MNTSLPRLSRGLTRRDLLRTGLAAGAMLPAAPLVAPGALRAQGKRGGVLRVRGYDPPHFAPNSSFDYGNRAAALWLDR